MKYMKYLVVIRNSVLLRRGFYPNEKIYAALGRSKAGRFLILFFIFKKNMHALILSARDMTGTERKKYEQQ